MLYPLGVAVETLFKQALGLVDPWEVVSCDFNPESKQLLIKIDFVRGGKFPDPEACSPFKDQVLCPVHDTVTRSWQHLNFFEHKTVIEARVPRVKTSQGSVRTVRVPWAEPQSGFTLLMEAFLLGLARVLPVAEVARQTGVSDDRIWHLLRTRVDEAWSKADWNSLERLGVDETSTKKGHKYGTAFLEIEGKETSRGVGGSKVARLLYFTPGKDKATFSSFAEELEKRGVARKQITEIAMDMSPAFISGAGEHFEEAQICFDRFHVMKLCGAGRLELRAPRAVTH